MPSCPTCHEAAKPAKDNQAYPFCSSRCQLLDLGQWLDGAYVLPGPPAAIPEANESNEDDERFELSH